MTAKSTNRFHLIPAGSRGSPVLELLLIPGYYLIATPTPTITLHVVTIGASVPAFKSTKMVCQGKMDVFTFSD